MIRSGSTGEDLRGIAHMQSVLVVNSYLDAPPPLSEIQDPPLHDVPVVTCPKDMYCPGKLPSRTESTEMIAYIGQINQAGSTLRNHL